MGRSSRFARRAARVAAAAGGSLALHALVVAWTSGFVVESSPAAPAPPRALPVSFVAPPPAASPAGPPAAPRVAAQAPTPVQAGGGRGEAAAKQRRAQNAGVARPAPAVPVAAAPAAAAPALQRLTPVAAEEFGLPTAVSEPVAADAAARVLDDARAEAGGDADGAAAVELAAVAQGRPRRPPAPSAAGPASDAGAPWAIGPLPAPPGDREMRFKVHYGEYAEGQVIATIVYRLVVDGERYSLRSEGRAAGLTSLFWPGALTQSSTGELGPEGFRPLHYAEQRGRRAQREVRFDHARAALDGASGTAPLVPGAQDRLSVLFQLGLLVRAAPERFAPGTEHVMPLASMRAVTPARFRVVARELLPTDADPIDALHLLLSPQPGSGDPRIDVWLGYDSGMLPVRIRVEDPNGRVLDQLIQMQG